MEQRIVLHQAVIAEKFAVGAFRFDVAAAVEIALDDDLGVGRHTNVVGDAPDDAKRCAAQPRQQFHLIGRDPHGGGDVVYGVSADGEADRQILTARGTCLVDRLEIARRDQIDPGLVAAAQHQSAAPGIGPAIHRIDRVIERGGDVGRAIEAMLEVDRKPREIGVLAA